ncbi:MAG: DUF2500 domain-containing protein [Ruminococcus sp.]|uniref:DUF2500 domain-containing protein n=1 Tax=Ruminococcus sp. TaxID=41978 RepID=UPI0025FB1784|nr:DUF2500 domain-containing protein [Ruminococcus sp.]MBR5684263.1 DUF2500 domain-containing protein [Ruminococcus sp.]
MFNKNFDKSFEFAEIMFFLVFFLVLGLIIAAAVRSIIMWQKNNNSPRLTVDASVVTKRVNVSRHKGYLGDARYHAMSSTRYYVTFQVESGDRFELLVSGQEYGMLAEGDRGKLTFQGTRYLSFERGY